MPKPGWASITITRGLYEMLKAEYLAHKEDLAKVGICSVSGFAEAILIESLPRQSTEIDKVNYKSTC